MLVMLSSLAAVLPGIAPALQSWASLGEGELWDGERRMKKNPIYCSLDIKSWQKFHLPDGRRFLPHPASHQLPVCDAE